MIALAPQTSKIFDKITELKCIRPYLLVGGTALSIQLQARLSEDLDFMSWKTTQKSQKQEVDWFEIEKELAKIGMIENNDIWDLDHVQFIFSGVKISFYASNKF